MKNLAQWLFQLIPGLIVDSKTRSVVFRDHRQLLPRIEFSLLEQLCKLQSGRIHREDLLRNVLGIQISVEPRTVASHIVRLRKKYMS